jgi:signal transduction histidine kinase
LPDDRIELRYSDDGKGIPTEIQCKIFDPFFTTQCGNGGSGLGLNLVYNIVHQTLKGT